jgi:hypothetical protein
MWECVYKHDRRLHRHRCHQCAKIVSEGERVIMWRASRGTKVIHIDCADKPHPCETYRDGIKLWSAQPR